MSIKDDTYGVAELQNKLLEILKYFIAICEEHGLRYWLAYGTCLGAVRHQGFIPWDDDLDVQMPREDYEKLWDILKENQSDTKYKLCRTSYKANYHHRVMQIVDMDTTFINRRSANEDIEHGVYIDIIPMDGLPKGKIARLTQKFNAILFSIYNIQTKPEYNGGKLRGVLSFGTFLLLSMVKKKENRYKIWKKCEANMIKYKFNNSSEVISLACLFKELYRPYKIEWFAERKVMFEDIKVNIPSNAEKYLEQLYGDYMKMPPESERTVKHDTVFIDLHNSYLNYKGIHYMREGC